MPRNFLTSFRVLAICAASSLAMAPVGSALQAQTAVQAISAKDKQQGAEAHPQLLAEFGGAMTGPQAQYVEYVGKNISVQSGLSGARDDFTVTLLNSSVNNAFAIPGGYVYTTRQLVALMNNEAELAGVLGHEVGHVAARHAAKRQSAATRNSILGIGLAVLSGAILGNNALGSTIQKGLLQGSQLLTLKYSRGQELEADRLGIAYLKKGGYDPRAMSTVLQSLANQNALESKLMGSQNRVPAWASTHPDPASRVRTALSVAGSNSYGSVNRDLFLTRVNGLLYGDDPKQGIVEGRRFTHPEFRMAFDAPNGFYLVNGTRAVAISGQSGKGELSTGPYSGDLDSYIRAVFGGLTQSGQAKIDPGQISRATINGIPAARGYARVNSNGSQVDVTVVAYEFAKDRAYHFLTIAPAGGAATFDGMYSSMRRISDAEAKAIKPRKLAVVTVKRGDTVQSLSKLMAYADAPLERFLVLNALQANSTLAAGQKVKVVTY